jgi:hypothetical protein
VHAGEPVDSPAHKCRLTVGNLEAILWIASDHAAVVVERPATQSYGASEARQDTGQSRIPAIILPHPQAPSMGYFAAEWWDRAFDNKTRIDKVGPAGKP